MEQIAVYPELKRLKAENEELKRKNEDLEERLAITSPDVIRCKDCKHKEKDGISEGFHYCNVNGLQVTDDWYCADGEPKGEET